MVNSVSNFSELTVLDIGPLLCFEFTIEVLELVFSVGLPSNVIVIDNNLGCGRLASIVDWSQAEGIVEETLGNETAGVCGFVIFKSRCAWYNRFAEAGILVGLDRVAVVKLINLHPVAHHLFVRAGLDVPTMVLIKIIELVVDVDGLGDVAVDVNDL